MTDLREITVGSATRRLLEILQLQPTVDGVQPGVLQQLKEAAEQVEQEHADLVRREQAARTEAEAARAEVVATRAKADEAVKALADSEQRYRYMGETIPFGVWWCNPKGEAEYVSPSFSELLDMTVEEQNKFGWTKRLVPEDVEPMMTKWLHCCATGTPWDHEHRIIDRHGKINTVLSRGLPVRDEAGQIIAWVGVNLDITERKRIELQLKEAKEALEQALHVKDQFLANISHELRTPLTLVLGPVRKLLSATNLSDEQRHDLKVVERNARTLLKNVNDLLDLSKLDAGRMKAEYAETDVARLARYVASHFESVADDKQIHFEVQTPESLQAQVDPEKFQRILFNLLSNAFKFTPAQGAVRFSLRVEEAKAVVTVEDTGPGIPAEMRQTIFERFRQVEGGPTRRHGGTGLGLAIVKEFVNLHQGSVAVTEAAGGGAQLTVELPLAAPSGTAVRTAEPAPDEEAARGAIADLRTPVDRPTRHGGPSAPDAPLVLVVEDNPEMNAFVAESLGTFSRVATAFDGREGLDMALRLRPDLIVSDLMMPRMSGEDLVREVRGHRKLDDVPILLLTAKADENLRVKLLSTGAQDCLTKPFVTEELVARARGLIARKRKAEEDLRESYAMLEQRVEQRTAELAAANKELEAFAYTVSHDLRAPLRHISGFVEMLGQHAAATLDEEGRDYVRTIAESAGRMGSLIDDLLALSRLGRASMSETDVDLGRLVEEARAELAPAMAGRAIDWQIGPLPHVLGDRTLLRNVVVNLVSNAIKYSRQRDPAHIEVGSREQNGEVVCFVRDNGAGFDMQFVDKLFGVFQRLHPAEKFEGTGVGLASVRRIIERHGGRTWAEGAVNQGATFYFSLPGSRKGA